LKLTVKTIVFCVTTSYVNETMGISSFAYSEVLGLSFKPKLSLAPKQIKKYSDAEVQFETPFKPVTSAKTEFEM